MCVGESINAELLRNSSNDFPGGILKRLELNEAEVRCDLRGVLVCCAYAPLIVSFSLWVRVCLGVSGCFASSWEWSCIVRGCVFFWPPVSRCKSFTCSFASELLLALFSSEFLHIWTLAFSHRNTFSWILCFSSIHKQCWRFSGNARCALVQMHRWSEVY